MSTSPDTDPGRCKAIAISTGQRCTRRGKLDGYCTEKHKQQADSTNGLWGLHRQPGASPFTDSEGETQPTPADMTKKSKTNKALKALGIKKSAVADNQPAPASAPAPVPVPTPLSASTPSPTGSSSKVSKASSSKTSKTTTSAKKVPATRKKAATKTTKAKKQVESSEEFEPDSDDDYQPSDSGGYSDSDSDDDDDDDDDEDDTDEDLDELSGKMASVRIKPDDPALPPRPSNRPLGAKLKRTKSKIVNTTAVLAPPKNKTKASSKTGRPTGGFWVAAPAPVKIPESTLKILSSVRDKLTHQDSSSSDLVSPVQSSNGEKKHSSLFKYRARMQSFLFRDEDESDQDSKKTGVRSMFKSLFHKIKKSDSDIQEKPLPELPSKSSNEHRPSVDSADSVTKDISELSLKDSPDEAPNQCHGFNSNGHRCKRKVKLDRPIEKGEVLMCHDHEVNEDDEVVVHIEGKGGVMLQWLDLSSWVNPNLPDYVQNKLRKAMERPVSDTDKPGYIYAYQLLETRVTDSHTLFKVGRTDNVFRRMSEWSDKCGSPPRLIEVFPEQGSLAPKDENDLSETVMMVAGDNEVTGLRCRYAHRVERLIHIELKPYHDKDHICACKTNHREWFKVPHQPGLSESKQMKQAWGQVRRVIVHWMAYMEHVYGPG
ncbi:meiotically up-regulated gene 113-domain-containing protein [Gamsiella multidivaricata]|uniref:meiotically up-regulated gene 113-domain-containing protein n=1 Tax=Gamsiella multidivaricata TaxID=101098 RepID=UPI00221E7988|nr:meiotically up-regulated gene 113-domain-containing protein [Gamsiella multidivaricata]KAG0355978.1 hypothetical protein BGZ54_000892 [Gamsiella multidivaricata]KAI7826199.1 meiotically up-regulated gene 113-domain-containing protein [Gamsiella multidivaricata]